MAARAAELLMMAYAVSRMISRSVLPEIVTDVSGSRRGRE